ncbi:thymidylate kinase [Candidatus Poribacteria bacterium]|nr:thymidylate kinase [Candidatus Poribacteria bacterium]
MQKVTYYGAGFPYIHIKELPGKLIVLEGTDGVGRSTQIQLLKKWIEEEGFGVSDTGLARSRLTQKGLDEAKAGHTLGPLTMSLFYATDFADRLENLIIPALEAGFYLLSDRYFYSIIARNVVRGVEPDWARKIYGFALKPDIILYLKADVNTILPRVVHGGGFNYWESGMDIRCADNLYDSFVIYQNKLIQQFDLIAEEYGFITIDATRSIQEVFQDLQKNIRPLFNKP